MNQALKKQKILISGRLKLYNYFYLDFKAATNNTILVIIDKPVFLTVVLRMSSLMYGRMFELVMR